MYRLACVVGCGGVLGGVVCWVGWCAGWGGVLGGVVCWVGWCAGWGGALYID